MSEPKTESTRRLGGPCGCIVFAAFVLALLLTGNIAYSCIRYGRQPIECSRSTRVCVGYVGDQFCPLETGFFGYRTEWR